MSRFPQKTDKNGSLRQIQKLINKNPELLNTLIKQNLDEEITGLTWLSPLKDDQYAEYRDSDFIIKLGVANLKIPLENFWPNKGPRWDALGKSDKAFFMVESNANIDEMISPLKTIQSNDTFELIDQSIDETKAFIQPTVDVEWTFEYYQYSIRLAHLYFLREVNNIPAYLIFIYFINDESVDGPKTKEEWMTAIQKMKDYLGLTEPHKLSPYIIDLFIDINDIKTGKGVNRLSENKNS